MQTSEEITGAMEKALDTPITNVESVLADYIRELHDRLREAQEELAYALPTDDSPTEIQERIDATLAKLPEAYR